MKSLKEIVWRKINPQERSYIREYYPVMSNNLNKTEAKKIQRAYIRRLSEMPNHKGRLKKLTYDALSIETLKRIVRQYIFNLNKNLSNMEMMEDIILSVIDPHPWERFKWKIQKLTTNEFRQFLSEFKPFIRELNDNNFSSLSNNDKNLLLNKIEHSLTRNNISLSFLVAHIVFSKMTYNYMNNAIIKSKHDSVWVINRMNKQQIIQIAEYFRVPIH